MLETFDTTVLISPDANAGRIKKNRIQPFAIPCSATGTDSILPLKHKLLPLPCQPLAISAALNGLANMHLG